MKVLKVHSINESALSLVNSTDWMDSCWGRERLFCLSPSCFCLLSSLYALNVLLCILMHFSCILTNKQRTSPTCDPNLHFLADNLCAQFFYHLSALAEFCTWISTCPETFHKSPRGGSFCCKRSLHGGRTASALTFS